jgi:hypothetical protein
MFGFEKVEPKIQSSTGGSFQTKPSHKVILTICNRPRFKQQYSNCTRLLKIYPV